MSAAPARVLALWSPDWPVTAAARAAHVPAHRPAAVFVANRVLACSAVARAQGIRRGLRRREAQARCPDLAVLTPDPDRDARAFEPVVAAVEELAPGVEIVRPGLVALAAKGPVGWFGGEQFAAERLIDQVAARTGVECQVGLADGLFAAVLAARRGMVVAPGATPAFLAPLGVEELDREPDVDRSELIDLLRRLGLRSLGAFGALDAQDVASRFGADAVLGHRLARGLDPRPPIRRRPPEDLTAVLELDPPVDRVDAAAFAARGLADRLHRTLAGHGLSCTRIGVGARTVEGEELYRIWRCAEPLTPAGTADRVRWQLDAWLTQRARRRPPTGRSAPRSAGSAVTGSAVTGSAGGGPGAVSRLWLVPEETVTAGALQLGLWGEVGEADERAGRALVRVQALLGPESVVTAVLGGGRDPAEQVRLVPWGDERADGGPERSAGGAPAGSGGVGGIGRPGAVAATDGSGLTTVSHTAEEPPPVIMEAEARPTAPAGWPKDVVRRAGRVSAAEPPAAADPPAATMIIGWGPSTAPNAAGRPGPSIIGGTVPVEPPAPANPAPATPASGRFANRKHRPPARRSMGRATVHDPPPPWPGRLPAPSPATVPPRPLSAELVDAAGVAVYLTAPDLLSAPPRHLVIDGCGTGEVKGWAGPWPLRQRWWTSDGVEGSRLQVVCEDGTAFLLRARDGKWWVTGVYD